ncbi:MAG: amino acid adenylation domain-containing protein [Planctomycetota bacterium]
MPSTPTRPSSEAEEVPAEWRMRAHEIFESAVGRFGDRLALVCGDERLSYAEVEARANAIAHALIGRGVRRGDRVALAIPRRSELVTGMLGILKAGGSYLPIDPRHPPARSREVLRDARPEVILTDDPLHPAWEEHGKVVDVRGVDASMAHRPSLDGDPRDIAYVLYTSGSTGTPKGVPIPHEGIGRLVFGQHYAPFGPDLSWLKVAPMGFDASTIEIYGALLHGATLVMWDRSAIDADDLADMCIRERVGACFMSFGLFSTMFDLRPDMFASMRVVTTGGEAVLPEVMRRAVERFPDVGFMNGYGPTEATAFTMTCEITPALLDRYADSPALPIGHALAGLSCRVLADDGVPVAPGESGELCVSGIGVTRGYLNRPELNREKFREDPLTPGVRLYRTGDIVRRVDDGPFEFLGRRDGQVKIRGNRVELGEIDAVVGAMPGVRQAAAGVLGGPGSERIGLLAVKGQARFDETEIMRDASERLPEYMVPSVVVQVESIPVTHNGKVDRRLVADMLLSAEVAEHTEPVVTDTLSGATERVAAIWSDVLGTPVNDASRTFVSFGGHSLKAMVVASRIRSMLGVAVPVPVLLGSDTLADIGDRIESMTGVGDELVSPDPSGQAADPAQPSRAQERIWILDRLSPGGSAYVIAIRLVSDHGLDREAFERACLGLIRRHAALRSGFVDASGRPVRRVIPEDRLDLEQISIEWVDEAGIDINAHSADEGSFAKIGFDLSEAPLIRFCVSARSDGSVVLISMHHIVSDGWSCEVIQRDLAELYRAARWGDRPVLPEVAADPDQCWPEPDPSDLDWWRGWLRDAPCLSLPRCVGVEAETDHHAGARASCVVGGEAYGELRALAVRLGVTPFAVVNAAFHAWLHRVTRDEDIVIGLPLACREGLGLEHAVGFLMATVPMRTRLRSDDSGRALIARVASSFEASNTHRSTPFQDIAAAVPSAHTAGRNPLFEVFFNHISLDLSGGTGDLRFGGTEIDNGSAKFDLTCYAIESNESVEILLNARRSVTEEDGLADWANQIARMLRGIVADPERRIGSIGLQSVPITQRFNTGGGAPTGSLLAHRRVLDVCERMPDRIACRVGGRTLNYRELSERAGEVRESLLRSGVRPGDGAVIACGRGVEAAYAILGTMAAGAVALIGDGSWPDDRIRSLAHQCGAKFILSDLESVRSAHRGLLVAIDPGSPVVRGTDSPPIERSAEDPAYTLFTSGTTGEPKGVVQSHGGLVRLIEAFADSIELSHHDSVVMTSSLSFDSAIMDMFGAWFRGAEWRWIDAAEDGLAKAAGATVFHAAPGVMRALSSFDPDGHGIASVRAVVLGGEPAFERDMHLAAQLFPGCRLLVNGMGMSESSLTAQWRGAPSAHPAPGPLPIGGPVAGHGIRLLDASGLPTDLFGELEITSDSVAIGYTSTDGINPLGAAGPGHSRRFRTGDLVRVRRDGLLEHAGRLDEQIKIMGVRIEPAGVQAILCALPGVLDAVVFVLRNARGEPALGAAVETEGATADPVAIRTALSERLPRTMVPAVIVCVDAIPRLGSGKPDPEEIRKMLVASRELRPPQQGRELSQTEHAVVECFRDVLGAAAVGPDDDFFAMGGNSLLALRTFARLKDRLGADIPVVAMFRAPTPARLAALIDSDQSVGDGPACMKLAGQDGSDPLYFAPGIGGNPHSFAPLAELLGTDFACMGYQLPGVLGHQRPIEDIAALAEHFAAQIPPTHSQRAPHLVGYSFGGSLVLQAALRFQRQGRKAGALIMIDAHYMPGIPRKGPIRRGFAHAGALVSGAGSGRLAYLRRRLGRRSVARELGGAFRTDETLRPIKRLIEVNRRALAAYRPALRYDGDLLLFRARQPSWMRFHDDDGVNGWRSCISGQISVIDLEVEHNRILDPASAPTIAGAIRGWLDEQDRDTG